MTQSVCSGDLKGEGDRARRLSICEFLEREERCLVMEGRGDHGQQESAGEQVFCVMAFISEEHEHMLKHWGYSSIVIMLV